MLIIRTAKARHELQPGVRNLSQKQRSVLLLADGSRSLVDLRALFDGEAEHIALELLAQGYLELRSAANGPAPAASPLAGNARTAPADRPPVAAPGPATPTNADAFEGKRSLATTRMFLFDLCERMFARRDPALAERFRLLLREARTREGMLAASREMLADIEAAAGAERADSIAQRLAMLLPPETV